jgi:hypothetical protein
VLFWDQYARKWIAFLHGGDEAVYALRQLRFAKFSLFQSDFVQQVMFRVSVYALPIALPVAISVPAFGEFVWATLKGMQRYLGDPIESLLETLGYALALPFRGVAWLLGMTVDQLASEQLLYEPDRDFWGCAMAWRRPPLSRRCFSALWDFCAERRAAGF